MSINKSKYHIKNISKKNSYQNKVDRLLRNDTSLMKGYSYKIIIKELYDIIVCMQTPDLYYSNTIIDAVTSSHMLQG